MAAATPQRAFPVLPSKTVVMRSPKYLLPSSGPFSHPRRPAEPCKICHVAIESEETALTHTLSPCHTSFHAECLLEWLPYASITPLEHDVGKGPSCPNCRQALGKCSTTAGEQVEFDTVSNLPGFAHPVENIDEIRAIVGNEVFVRRRLADRRFAVPVSSNEIPVENPDADSLADDDVVSQRYDGEDGILDLWQELNAYRVPDARQEIGRLMDASISVSNTDTAVPYSHNKPIPASAVYDLLDAFHVTKGVTHYTAYTFPESEYSNTTFYVPIYPWFNVMQWYVGYEDRIWAGRWLRGPLIHSLEEARAVVRRYGQFDAELDLGEIVDSVNRTEQLTIEGFAFWVPSDVCDDNGRGKVYAVPWVSMDVSDLPRRDEGEIVCGFFRNDSLSHEVDENTFDRRYWVLYFDEHLHNHELGTPRVRDFMDAEASNQCRDLDSLVPNEVLRWEVMDAPSNELTTVTGDE